MKTEYYDVPIESETFLSPNKKLLRSVVNRKNPTKPVKPIDVDKFMQDQDPYTLHRRVNSNAITIMPITLTISGNVTCVTCRCWQGQTTVINIC